MSVVHAEANVETHQSLWLSPLSILHQIPYFRFADPVPRRESGQLFPSPLPPSVSSVPRAPKGVGGGSPLPQSLPVFSVTVFLSNSPPQAPNSQN